MRLFIILWCLTFSSFAAGIIGDIILHTGNAVIEQDGEDVEAEKDLDIFSYNTVKTGKGKVAIGFIDDTRVDVTEHSKLIIDEFVYDPNTKTGSLSHLKPLSAQYDMHLVRLQKQTQQMYR